MTLDQVFWHFLEKFQTLPIPRSVVLARTSASEVEFLRQWFADQYGKPRNWCDRTWQESIEGDVTASDQEMFGALFLIFASEICRDHCDEESVWPGIRNAFMANKSTYGVLFDASGQPTTACKAAIGAGARRLGIRNLIDRYGTQEYFETLKLQIGFTIKGARRRLPEWLDGQGPTAAQILIGSKSEFSDLRLESKGFSTLWRTIQDYRRNRISEASAASVLESSPWVRSSWVAELLMAAQLRPAGRVTSASAPTMNAAESAEPLCVPMLLWDYPGKPRLVLRLSEDAVLGLLVGHNSAVLAIDGRIVDRWTLPESGNWRGKRELPCEPDGESRPNLRPRILSISSGDTSIKEVDLSEHGLVSEPLLIFDLGTGHQIDPNSKLDRERNYVVVCESDMEVPNARPWKGEDRSAFLLSRPLASDTQVYCAGLPYWQPQLGESPGRRSIRLTLESAGGEITEIGESASHLVIKDAPVDANAASLVIGGRPYVLVRVGEEWRTQNPIKISLEMATGSERVRVRIEGKDYSRTVIPRLSLSLRGIAVIESDGTEDLEPQWKLLDRKRPLNRAAGAGKARVFFENRESELYEGPCFVRQLNARGLDLRDLHGWGHPLIVQPKDSAAMVLVDSVEDQGCAGLFIGKRMGKYDTLYRRTPQQPSPDHAVLVWNDIDARPRVIPGNEVRSEADGFIWKLPELSPVAVLAITYKGAWMGAYWNKDLIAGTLCNSHSAESFALIRWLKLPALNPTFRPSLQRAVSLAPTEFVRGWLDDSKLPHKLLQRHAEQGLNSVIRAFLWNHLEKSESRMSGLVQAFRHPTSDGTAETESELFKRGLLRVAEICPGLAYTFAKVRVHGEKYAKFVRSVLAEILGQPSAEPSQLSAALSSLGRDCTTMIGISQTELGAHVDSYRRFLDGGALDAQADTDLRRLGERERGWQFLAASMLAKLLERT